MQDDSASLIMVLEDDALLRAQIARSLQRIHRVEVVEAATIHEACELAAKLPIDLVVADLRLPDGTALELLPYLQRDGARIPTLLISGYAETFAKDVPAGLTILEKPIPASELRAHVAAALGQRVRRSPFALADYLQLADLGRHSVQIDLDQRSLPRRPLGLVVVRDGQPWTALDEHGDGVEALARLMRATDVEIVCTEPSPIQERPSLVGSCAQVLRAARAVVDEACEIATSRTATRPMLMRRLALVPAAEKVQAVVPVFAEGSGRAHYVTTDRAEPDRDAMHVPDTRYAVTRKLRVVRP
jgi:CheY-like chemotaxis protein